MSELKVNLSDYKASGVYFLEIDNSIRESTSAGAMRVAVGFNGMGPFNRPIYMSSTEDCDSLLGPIEQKYERRGCFTNRNIRTMVDVAPVYALNLLPVDTIPNSSTHTNLDVVGINALSFQPTKNNTSKKALFADMFDRTRFWVADENALMGATVVESESLDAEHAPLFSVGNCGTKDLSVIIRKAEGLSGYNVTFLDWYGSEDAIPYKWIDPQAYVADYFIQVIIFKGNWSESMYANYATDPVWGEYFTARGLKKDKLNKFLKLDAVTVVGNAVGCIIPNFYDKRGVNQSIAYALNKVCNKTGLLFGTNEDALEALALNRDFKIDVSTNVIDASTLANELYFLDLDGTGSIAEDRAEVAEYIVDMNGAMITAETAGNSELRFLSYNIPADDVMAGVYQVAATWDPAVPNELIVRDTDSNAVAIDNVRKITIGDYVRLQNGTLGRIIKKRYGYIDASTNEMTDASTGTTGYVFTISGAPHISSEIKRYAVGIGENTPEPSVEGSQYYTVIGNDATIDEVNGEVSGWAEIHKSITSYYETLNFLPLSGLKITNRHMPGFDKDGNVDYEAGVEKIYSMLEDPGIRRGMKNREMLEYRYIVDTMAYGLGAECRGKKYLTDFAGEYGRCLAIINAPSMTQFAASDAPFFGKDYVPNVDARPSFDPAYIATGGNQDILYPVTPEFFSLPLEENGAEYTAVFAPFLKYLDGARTILVPPAADVSNTFMRKHLGADPYKTTANLNGILNNGRISGLEYPFDDEERGALEPFGINPIITRNGLPMIYGDRTAYQTVNSDKNYIHVRELINTIEIECNEILHDYVFDYNNAQTRSEVVSRLNPILKSKKDSGALYKYQLQMDENNNTQEIIDKNFGIVDIHIWVTRNMEKILTRITLNRGSEAAV